MKMQNLNKEADKQAGKRPLAFSILDDISQIVNQTLDLDDALKISLKKVTTVLHADTALIRLFDDEARELVIAAHTGFSKSELNSIIKRRGAGGSLSWRCFETGNISIQNQPFQGSTILSKTGIRSSIVLPLKSKARPVGTMGIHWRKAHTLQADEIQMLASIGSMVGTAVENARLFTRLKKHSENLDALNSISQSINQSLELNDLLQTALSGVIGFFKVDCGFIRLLDAKSQILEVAVHKGLSKKNLEKLALKRELGDGNNWRAIQTNQVQVITYDPGDPYQQKIKAFGLSIGAQNSIIFPLKSKDQILGTMTIYTFKPRRFSNDEIDMCAIIGSQIGTAIENANLYRKAKNTVELLKETQKEREKLISSLQKALEEVKTLSGLIPICSYCKNIRDDRGYWSRIEAYIHRHSGAEFSHSICPECAKKYFPDFKIYD
ncbi:MAG: GAF domain-containing protein [Thermodesulfobacteriota bacterium]